MARVYVVRVERPERGFVDPVSIRANSRQEAETFAQQMFQRERVIIRGIPPPPEPTTVAKGGMPRLGWLGWNKWRQS